jgi:small subunit ribosomal protein S4
MSVANPQVKLSRKLNIALTPKATKHMDRRPYPPGEHGPQKIRRGKVSDYKQQLLEKQRLRLQYNLREKQMRNYVRKAVRKAGNAADNLVQVLESRLDALVYRSGFARTMPAARQFVSHGHILVNGRKVDIPSCPVRPDDVVAVKSESRKIPAFAAAFEELAARPAPAYLERREDGLSARLTRMPTRDEVNVHCEYSKVIEYYAR